MRSCVDVESQVIASRLITIHTLANGDKVSNPVHDMSLAHFKANRDTLRPLLTQTLSKFPHNKICNLHESSVTFIHMHML